MAFADSKQVVCAGFTESAAERRVFIAGARRPPTVMGRPLYFAAVVTIVFLLSSFFSPIDDAKCIVVTRICVCVCLCVCPRYIHTLLH